MDLLHAIWVAATVVAAALLLKLVLTKLYRIYPFLFGYLFVNFITDLVMVGVPMRTDRYALLYFATQSVALPLSIGVVLELYRLALSKHPALASFGSRAVVVLFALGTAVGIVGLLVGRAIPPGQSPVLHGFFAFERTIDFVMTIVLLAMSSFLLWFPVPMNRNIAICIIGFIASFVSRALELLLANLLRPSAIQWLDLPLLCISSLCVLLWAIVLRKEGESRVTIPGHRWNPSAIAQLTGQLESINAALIRFSKN